MMIYIKIQEVMKAKRIVWGRKITLCEVAIATGISSTTLFRMMKNQGYSTVTDQFDKLCTLFECDISELVKFVPDNQLSHQAIAA